MAKTKEKKQEELTLEIAFNNVVGVAREMKLNHSEHVLLERSVQMLLKALQGDQAPTEAPELPATTSKKSRKRVSS
tara:strand:- start:850 stop:1077 length:228 start_codon:yes stop_codon:yes gene_type:complete